MAHFLGTLAFVKVSPQSMTVLICLKRSISEIHFVEEEQPAEMTPTLTKLHRLSEISIITNLSFQCHRPKRYAEITAIAYLDQCH